MALSVQNQNFISECMQNVSLALGLRDTLIDMVARWNLNDISNELTDGDIEVIAKFSHLKKNDVISCITAFQAILTALGDNSSGQSVNLIKMKG